MQIRFSQEVVMGMQLLNKRAYLPTLYTTIVSVEFTY